METRQPRGLALDPKAATSAGRHVRTARGIKEEADNAGVDNDKVTSGRHCRPATATTVADAANVDNDEATNSGRRRSKTVSDAAGVDDDEGGGRPRPPRRRRTTPASMTTRSYVADAAVPPMLMTIRTRTADAAVPRPTSMTTRPRTTGAAGPPMLLLLAVGRVAASQAENATRRAYAVSIANNLEARTLDARCARTVQAAVRTAEPDARAVDEGSNGDKAAARARWRVYAASGLAHDPSHHSHDRR